MKIGKDYAVIETADEAASLTIWKYLYSEATRAEVLKAITPKEGDAVFWWFDNDLDTRCPKYAYPLAVERDGKVKVLTFDCVVTAKANALTIGKTVGELRELLAWARSE